MTPICPQLAAMKDTSSMSHPCTHDHVHWVDYGDSITEYCQTHNVDAGGCVQQMRDRVREEMNLTVSAGIAPNMVRMMVRECFTTS